MLFLRLEESGWQRIFIEAGVVFWQTVDVLDSPDQDRHHYTLTDLAAEHGLAGRRLIEVITADLPAGGELRLLFSGDACAELPPRGRPVAGGGGGRAPGKVRLTVGRHPRLTVCPRRVSIPPDILITGGVGWRGRGNGAAVSARTDGRASYTWGDAS